MLGRAGNILNRWFLHKDERRKGEEEHRLASDGANWENITGEVTLNHRAFHFFPFLKQGSQLAW